MANTEKIGLFQMIDRGLLHPNESAATADSNLLVSGVNYDVAMHNADIDAILGSFCENTVEYQLEVQQGAASYNQPLDEFGRALPIKQPVPYTVAFPILSSGSAVGGTFLANQLLSVGDFAKQLSQMLRGDALWVRDHVWAAMFDNVTWTFRDPLGHGNLSIYPLANSDTTTFFSAYTSGWATDDHYLAQAAAISDAANPYPTIKDELLEHPDNTGEVVAFISTSLVTTTTNLAEFHTVVNNPNVDYGPNVATVNGNLGITLPPNSRLIGATDSGVWIVEWRTMPAGYILATTTGGRRPLMRRQYDAEALKGFKAQGTREDYPYYETQWARHEGYGGLNRTGAVVYYVGGANYTIPTNYDGLRR